MSGLSATKISLSKKSEEVRMPAVLETDDTKAWRIYKETDEVKQTFKNWGLGTIHSYMKAKQMIYTHTKTPQPNKKKTSCK